MLDIMLPDLEGIEVCRRLRDQGEQMPVVFLTARDATEDKVEGLAMGDDYVTKPFSLDELVARVGAVLRRAGQMAAADSAALRRPVMNMDTHEVWREELPIDLTATEFNVLQYLLENVRRVMSKSEILDNVWDYGFPGDPNIVETYISYLRKKIDEHEPPLIHTVRRVGYSLRLPREDEPPPAARRHGGAARGRPGGGRPGHLRLAALLPLRPPTLPRSSPSASTPSPTPRAWPARHAADLSRRGSADVYVHLLDDRARSSCPGPRARRSTPTRPRS